MVKLWQDENIVKYSSSSELSTLVWLKCLEQFIIYSVTYLWLYIILVVKFSISKCFYHWNIKSYSIEKLIRHYPLIINLFKANAKQKTKKRQCSNWKKIWKTKHLENEGQEKNLDIYTEKRTRVIINMGNM